MFKVPEIVCYKGSWASYQIGKRLIKLDYISLVNLILNKEAVTELIQADFNTKNLKQELYNILKTEKRTQIFESYFELEQKLGGEGASSKTAQLIFDRF